MNISYAALAAIIFAGGTAVGFATGTQITSGTGQEERPALVDRATLAEDQNLISQSDELSRREEQAAQREAELDAQSEQLAKNLASLKVLEEDQARMYENLRAESEALEKQKEELDEQKGVIAAQLASVLQRENEAITLQQKLAAQSAAARVQELAENAESKLDVPIEQLVSRTASDPAVSGAELSTIALTEPKIAEKAFEEGNQTKQVAKADEAESSATVPSNVPIAEVHFELNSAKLTPGAIKRAREAATRLQSMNFSKIRIAGHTDTTGPASRNRALSNERAEAVAEIFVQAGVSRRMIEIVGFGETYAMLPVSTGDGISEPLNRCVGIFVEEVAQSSLQ